MTSLQFTQAQSLGYTRAMYRVPMSIETYDSVIKVHGIVLATTFLLPHGLGVYDLAAYALHQLYRYVCLVGSYQIACKH